MVLARGYLQTFPPFNLPPRCAGYDGGLCFLNAYRFALTSIVWIKVYLDFPQNSGELSVVKKTSFSCLST